MLAISWRVRWKMETREAEISEVSSDQLLHYSRWEQGWVISGGAFAAPYICDRPLTRKKQEYVDSMMPFLERQAIALAHEMERSSAFYNANP
jgi:hypothetical protein